VGTRARLLRLPGAGPVLVHGAGGDLLDAILTAAALLSRFLDVLVLPFALVTPRPLRHRRLLRSTSVGTAYPLPGRSILSPRRPPVAREPLALRDDGVLGVLGRNHADKPVDGRRLTRPVGLALDGSAQDGVGDLLQRAGLFRAAWCVLLQLEQVLTDLLEPLAPETVADLREPLGFLLSMWWVTFSMSTVALEWDTWPGQVRADLMRRRGPMNLSAPGGL